MTRIFDALKKAQAGRPLPQPSSLGGVEAVPPAERGLRELRPAAPRPGPEPMGGGATPLIVPIQPGSELPDDVTREMTKLRVSIESLLIDRTTRSVMFVSSQGREGTSTVAYQFAFTLAGDSRLRALLVDAHARRPSLHAERGARDAGGRRTFAADVSRDPSVRALDAWPLGEQFRDAGLLSAALVREVIEWGSGHYDWIVLDGPPVLESADAAPIAAVADGVIVVVEAGRTKRPVLQRSVELLRKAGGQVLGSVLNRRRLEIPEFIYRRI
ncbi:MAG TPA: CpsD/CapB family tyrosine-protein kinase [Candidatus Eisenbacteria bacterium]